MDKNIFEHEIDGVYEELTHLFTQKVDTLPVRKTINLGTLRNELHTNFDGDLCKNISGNWTNNVK